MATWDYASSSSQDDLLIGYSTVYIDGTTYEGGSNSWSPVEPTSTSVESYYVYFGFGNVALSLNSPLHTIGIVYLTSRSYLTI